MKQTKKIMIFSFIFLFSVLIGIYFKCYHIASDSKYTKEYVNGGLGIQGDINTDYFLDAGKDFEVGANNFGAPVFKTPHKAYSTLKDKYKDSLDIIQSEFSLLPLNKFNYESYKSYAWQVTSDTSSLKEDLLFISSFFDIYENSFIN